MGLSRTGHPAMMNPCAESSSSLYPGFLATQVPALAWVSVGAVILIAGLGMGVLAADLPEPRAQAGGGLPVTVIAVHGTLATTTILLVLLAAIGASGQAG
jgi:hypothetical protein